jgi:hypothetical protein
MTSKRGGIDPSLPRFPKKRRRKSFCDIQCILCAQRLSKSRAAATNICSLPGLNRRQSTGRATADHFINQPFAARGSSTAEI